jgi:DNA-binding NtrC family response regulator
MICRKALEKLGCVVDAAGNRLAAMALINNLEYEIIFLDLVIPPDSGVGILQRIRELNPAQIVIVLSGYVTADIGRSINQDEHTLIFEKPTMIDGLEALLKYQVLNFTPRPIKAV